MTPMHHRRNLILLGGVVVLAASIGVYYWQTRVAEEQAARAALRQETVSRGVIASTVSATGFLAPKNQINLHFPTTAAPLLVEQVNVALGQTVRKGVLLARLDTQDLRLAVTEAELALQSARLSLARLKAPPRPEDIALAEASLRLARAGVYAASQGNSPESVEIAYLNLRVAQTALDQTHTQIDILVDEYGDVGWLAKNAFLQSQADQQVIEAKIANERYIAAQAEPGFGNAASALASVEQAQVTLDRLKNGPGREDLEIAQLQVDQAETAVQIARRNLANAEIRAPFAGVVTAVNVQSGELATGAVPAIVLADMSDFFLDVAVDEIDAAQISPGQAVTVSLDALPDALLTGSVERVSLLAARGTDGVVRYDVRVSLDPTSVTLRGGMTAVTEIVVAEVRDVLLVPNWAIRRDQGRAFVGVLRDGVIGEVEVRLGLRNDSYSEVVSGLAENDVVAVDTAREQFRLFGGGP
jgi:HlyD family secretion protein